MIDNNKCTRLLYNGLYFGRKKFYDTGPRGHVHNTSFSYFMNDHNKLECLPFQPSVMKSSLLDPFVSYEEYEEF